MTESLAIPETSTIPVVAGHPLGQWVDFRRRRLAWQTRLAREYGDICQARLGFLSPVVVSGAELVQQVLVEKADCFVKSRLLRMIKVLLGDGILTSEHERHHQHRRLLAPGFQHRRLGQYAEAMVDLTEGMEATWKEGEPIDMAHQMHQLTLAIVAKTLFNSDVQSEAGDIGNSLTYAIKHVSHLVSALVPIPLSWPTPGNARTHRALARINRTVFRIIEERRRSGGDQGDMLSTLLAAEDGDSKVKLTDGEVRDEVMTLFMAGHETTANALSWTLYLLARHPQVAERASAEVIQALGGRRPTMQDLAALPYTLQVFREAVRLFPPAFVVTREAEREVFLGPYRIEKGQTLMLNLYALHHRADYWESPEVFDPERFRPDAPTPRRGSYLPFGAGPRSCIGAQFGQMEAHLVLATLLQRLRLHVVDDREIVPEPLITLRPSAGPVLKISRRAS